jgi:hypothetical protein
MDLEFVKQDRLFLNHAANYQCFLEIEPILHAQLRQSPEYIGPIWLGSYSFSCLRF